MTNAFSSHMTRTTQSGFSLLELSIALAVIGIVVAGGLTMSTSMVDRQAYVQTGNQMDEVDKAIAAYVAVNNRLPCPADPSLALTEPDYGMSTPGACSAAPVQHTVGTGGKAVAIGMLPVRTLGLRDRMAADEYGNRYTYAVTETLTSSAATGGYSDDAESGAITLADTGIDDAAYVVVSHGGDAKGAYRYETASNNVTCGAGGSQDDENCNGDATFRDTRFNRGSVVANWFDDSVRFARKEIINLNAGGATGANNQYWEANGDHIYNTNTQNVGIGIASPADSKLQVLGATFGQPAIKAVHNMNGIAVHGIGQGASPSFLAEFDDQNGVGYRADNIGWGGKLFEGIGDGSMNVGMFLDMSGDETVGVQIAAAGNDSTGILVNADTNGENYWNSDTVAFQSATYHPNGNVQVTLGSTQSGITVLAQETVDDFDVTAANFSVRTSCGGGSDCFGLVASALNANGTNTGGAHFGIAGYGGVAGVMGQGPNTGVSGSVWAPGAGSGSSVGGTAVAGDNQSSTGTAYGVRGTILSTGNNSAAVSGVASGTSGTTYGGYFTNASATSNTGAAAVYGETAFSNSVIYGAHFRVNSGNPASAAVYGQATNRGYGGYFTSNASVAQYSAVRGEIVNTVGASYGGHFINPSTSNGANGVRGEATALNPSGETIAGNFINMSRTADAIGVRGVMFGANPNVVNYGVYGYTLSSLGWGVYCGGVKCGGTAAWDSSSDIRLKENIHTLNDTHGLDAIRKLRAVTYEWKDQTSKTRGPRIGFIAQEVEKIFPEFVTTGADQEITLSNGKKETVTKSKAMSYAELTAPLVRAVQQLADKLDALFDTVKKLFDRVDAQDAKITALEVENKALKTRLDALEAKLAK